MGRGIVVSILTVLLLLVGQASATEECIACHESNTPGIVADFQNSKMAESGIECLSCHEGMGNDPSVIQDHNGFSITAVVSPKYCDKCHPDENAQFQDSKHAWTAFIGPLKPWYLAMKEAGKDPLSQETAKESNPREYVKRIPTPLFPDSGILTRVGILTSEDYNHENQVIGCMQCHGTYVIAEDGALLDGWPNVGVGRVNPDGSIGSCSACHTRHLFSRAEARKPETCGQCHLGPDHPQAEIYEESKHGNMFFSLDDHSFLEEDELTPGNTRAPTCAVCHMSAFNRAEGTHEVGARLMYELQPKTTPYQWKPPSQVDDIVADRVPDEAQAKKNRNEMKKVCRGCHTAKWANGYFDSFDKIISDYDTVWAYTDNLMQDVYAEGLADNSNPVDEIPETMHYYIWHHDGRRWRMGAAMMAPDWAHWNGAVDTALDKLTVMVNWVEQARQIKAAEEKIAELETKAATDDKGICGPTAIAAIALFPLGLYRIYRRRR
jgi:hypothetical protein